MNKIKRIIALVIMVTVVFSNVQVSASNITVRSSNTISTSILFDIDAKGRATCFATLLGKAGTTSISGAMHVYKNYFGTNKKLIQTWHVGTLTRELDVLEHIKLETRGEYTLVLHVNVFKGGVPETITVNQSDTY